MAGVSGTGNVNSSRELALDNMQAQMMKQARDAYKQVLTAEKNFQDIVKNNPTKDNVDDAALKLNRAVESYKFAVGQIKDVGKFIADLKKTESNLRF